jgi:hypothetical protein
VHFKIFPRLVIELELGALDSIPQNADVYLIGADDMWILKFVLELHLEFRLKRTQWG